MATKTNNERIILGLKIRQLRQARNLSFSDLAEATGMSVSYLNEIERGKKFPKEDKVRILAQALDIEEKDLLQQDLDPQLAPVAELLKSNFLNELPLDLFGIDLSRVAELVAEAPAQVGAFISTLLDLSRSYALREENFYFAALRSYLELHNNHLPDIEEAVDKFCDKYQLPATRPLPVKRLQELLEEEYGYVITEGGLDAYPELAHLRAVFVPARKELLLSSRLSSTQLAFQLGKELAFQFLGYHDRAFTSSIIKPRNFEQVLNHAKATYFSVALHLPLDEFVADLRRFFARPTWDGEAFLQLMQRFNATPEMYYHRLTSVLAHHLQLPKLFFMRFLHHPQHGDFVVDRELHLNRRHQPYGNAILEHYCRRWVSVSLLEDLATMQAEGKFVNTIVKAQRSKYLGTDDEYLCLTLARPGYPAPNRNVSVTIGLLITPELQKTIKWHNDPAIQHRQVHTTCERCTISDCQERWAPPLIAQKRERYQQMKNALALINGNNQTTK